MLLLPIVDRELRMAARNWRTYWTRVMVGLAALASSFYLIWMVSVMGGGALAGMFTLKATSYMAWALCIFAGINRTSDCLSSEKRADTLGLLFLTHLKGYDIVLGKLLASSLSAIFLLVGVLPILSIPVLLGGVSGSELLRVPVALLNSLLLAQGIGMFVSSLVRSQKAASGLSGFVFIVLAVFLPIIAAAVERDPDSWWWAPQVLRVFSPIYAHDMAFSATLGLSTNRFWTAILVQFLLAISLLVAACWIVPHTWKIPANRAGWREKFERWTHGTAIARLQRRNRLLARNPIYWLSCRDRFSPLWPFVFALMVLGALGWCIYYYEIPEDPAVVLLFAGLAINDLTSRIRVASIASGRLAEDRQSGALEMILSTPIRVREIVKGQWMAIRHIQLPAFCAILAFYLVMLFIAVPNVQPALDGFMVGAFFAFISIGDFVVVGYVAMWKGMRVTNPRHAPGTALFRVLLAPWGIWLALMPLIHEVSWFRGWFDSNEPYSYLGAACLIWLVNSATALVSARRNLDRHFREAATDRYVFERRVSWVTRLRAWKIFANRSAPSPSAAARESAA